MKYSLSIRQSKQLLEKADEICCEYKDIDGIFNIIEELNDKEYVIKIPRGTEIDWNLIAGFMEKAKVSVALADLSEENINKCKEFNIDFF